ncbi:MAG: hypothetical protein FWE24_07460 [Defluviitaleaceae bacterium]|nr:hypothetical protein [Defluviitaleaceae bacterium]
MAILNGILIIILAILLFIILLILLVLFIPVRYNVQLQYIDEKLNYNIRVSWLLRLISIRMKHSDTEDEMIVRVAWKRFSDNEPEDEPIGGSGLTNDKENEPSEPEPVISSESPEAEDYKDTKSDNKDKKEKSGIIENIKSFWESFKEIKEMDISISGILKEIVLVIKRLILALKPKIFILECEIGLDSPDNTGIAVGAAAALNGFIDTSPYVISVRGNFEEEVLNLITHIKGKITLWFGLWPFIRLYFSKSMKPIRKIIMSKLFKKKANKRKPKKRRKK